MKAIKIKFKFHEENRRNKVDLIILLIEMSVKIDNKKNIK